MKRRSARTKVGEVKPQEEKEVGWMTKTMSTSFLSLPPELMVMVASHLDVSSYIALASSSIAILDILVSPLQWKALLQKTNLEQRKTTMNFKEYNEFTKDLDASNDIPKEVRVAINLKKKSMEEEVKGLAVFLKFVKHSKGLLLLDLLHFICERFSTDENTQNVVSVSCPCNVVHRVTSFGFALLEQAETEVGGKSAKPKQKVIGLHFGAWYFGSGVEHIENIEEIVSRILRQKQKVAKIEIHIMTNHNFGTSGKARGEVSWLKLIENCKSWRIKSLWCNDLPEGLAKHASRGAIGEMTINDVCIVRSEFAHLKRMWNITEATWRIKTFIPDILMRREEWTWRKVIGMMKPIQQVMRARQSIQ